MKKLISIVLLTLSLSTYAYNYAPSWGEDVDVINEFTHYVLSTDIKAEDLILKVEEYGGFECEVSMVQGSKKSVHIYVDWFPGSDLSGCEIFIKAKNGKDFGSSTVYMNY